jgi:hypothetical protein
MALSPQERADRQQKRLSREIGRAHLDHLIGLAGQPAPPRSRM